MLWDRLSVFHPLGYGLVRINSENILPRTIRMSTNFFKSFSSGRFWLTDPPCNRSGSTSYRAPCNCYTDSQRYSMHQHIQCGIPDYQMASFVSQNSLWEYFTGFPWESQQVFLNNRHRSIAHLNRPVNMVHSFLLAHSMTNELGFSTHTNIHAPKVLAMLSVSRLINHTHRFINLIEGDVQVLEAVALDLGPFNLHRVNILPEF